MTGLEFATPAALALLPAPLLLRGLLKTRRRRAAGGLPLPGSIRDQTSRTPRKLCPRPALLATRGGGLAWIGLVFALAGPRVADAVAALPASGRDIMLALDLSGSMTKTEISRSTARAAAGSNS